MSQEIINKAERHKVTHEFSGKFHFFKVENIKGRVYNVSVQAKCDCQFFSVQGSPNGKICSHILAVLNKIVREGQIKTEVEDGKISKD